MDISVNLSVNYCDTLTGLNLSEPLITINITYGGIKIEWYMGNLKANDITMWEDINESIYNPEMISKVFCGGESPHWYCQCIGRSFRFTYEIMSFGYSNIKIDIPD